MLTVSVLSTAEAAEDARVTDIVRANPADVQLLAPYAEAADARHLVKYLRREDLQLGGDGR